MRWRWALSSLHSAFVAEEVGENLSTYTRVDIVVDIRRPGDEMLDSMSGSRTFTYTYTTAFIYTTNHPLFLQLLKSLSTQDFRCLAD